MVAKEVYVTISFPDEIEVITNDKISDVDFPKKDLPEHPKSIAEKRKKRAEKNRFEEISSIIKSRPIVDIMSINHNINNIKSTTIKNNSITLRMPKLMHTKCRIFDNTYSILPKKKGKFEIQVSIISEELEEPIRILLFVNVYRKQTR